MFKVKGNYPYPILLEEPIDYKTSTINVRYLYKTMKNGHKIKIECDITNQKINKLIKEKKACYAVQIESPNALYRKMFEFFDNNDITIELKNEEVIDYIDIGVAVLVKKDIDNYSNEDFVDAYQGINMKVQKNEILAVFQNVRQIIISNNETLKEVHSIFKLQKSKEIEYITYDPNSDRILITIPEDIGKYYQCCKGKEKEINILNGLIFTPVLTSIINDMKDGEEVFSNRLWFKTLNNKIEEIIKTEKVTKESVFENPYEIAQKILKNISIQAINNFKILLEEQEGDDN